MGNFNDIILHRNEVRNNILKSFDSEFDELEKGKWNVGDQRFYHGTMHYVAELKPDGSPRWRRVKKTSRGSDDVSTASSTKNQTAEKPKKSESSTSSDKPSVSKKTSEKPKKNDSQIKSVMNRIKEDFKNGVPMLQKNSKTETSYQTRRVGIKEFEEKLKTDYGKKFAKSFNEFSFKDVDFRNDRDGKYDVYSYFFNERGFTKIEDINDIYGDNHNNEVNLGLWIRKYSQKQSFLSREWDKKEYKIPYNGKKYHFVAETNLFMNKEGDGSYVPKLEFKINLVGVSNGKKIRRRNLTLGVCYSDPINYPYSQSKEEESKSFEKLKETYKRDGQRCRDVALYNFVSNFDGYFSKIIK